MLLKVRLESTRKAKPYLNTIPHQNIDNDLQMLKKRLLYAKLLKLCVIW